MKTDNEILLRWKRGLRFQAATSDGRNIVLDGDGTNELSPVDGLLASLAACMAIDVVVILKRMRLPLEDLRVEAVANRRKEQPRHITDVSLNFVVQPLLAEQKVRRAIDLSLKTYCSVLHTLRSDLSLSTTLRFVDGIGRDPAVEDS